MIKRKRLDARTFREWHVAQAKKHQNPVPKETATERRNTMSQDRVDNLEASCLKKKCRMDSEVKSPVGNGEATLEQCGSGAPEVPLVDHENMLSFVECGSDGTNKDETEGESNTIMRSEEPPDCKASSPRFIEYWVPAGFSLLQLEKYCETLVKNSILLCSSSKKEIVDGLHDVLAMIRECCDHPYLTDLSLQSFINEGRPAADYLSTGIEVSGKLLLLDKFLKVVREKQSRLLIVFQSNHSKSRSIHLRHILDDFIRGRFGEDSYVHIYREFDRSKKQAALDLFNDKESGRFMILIEKSSCQPSIKLSAVDFVILFNSDLNPINDMRSLRKMSIQSKQFDHLKVFRLYSSNTVEEKVLILAKEGNFLGSSISTISRNMSHMLLLWGTQYLFSKLDDFHSHCSTIADLNSLSEQKVVLDVLHELSALLSCKDSNKSRCSLISKVPEANDDYSANISLLGEQDAPHRDDDVPPSATWISLLERRNPQWRLLPVFSQRVRRRGDFLDSSAFSEHGTENQTKKALHSGEDLTRASGRKAGKRVGLPNSGGKEAELCPCRTDYDGINLVEETCNRRMKELLLKQKKQIREFYWNKREERTKLEEEHKVETGLINQRYTETSRKKEELKKLDQMYKEKLEKHNHKFDMKRKELENVQKALRIKEKQLKDKLFALLKTGNLKGPISSLVGAPLWDSELGLEALGLAKNSVDSGSVVSNSASLSESKHSREIEHHRIDGAVDHVDSGFTPERLPSELETLTAESGGENDAVLIPREAVSNTADHNAFISVASAEAPLPALVSKEKSQEMQHSSNKEIEGDGSTYMEASKETLHGVADEVEPQSNLGGRHSMGSMNGSLESDGDENDVIVIACGGAPANHIEPRNNVSDLCTSNEPELCELSGQRYLERLTNLPNREVQDEECSLEASAGVSNERRGNRGDATTATVAGQQSSETLAEFPLSRLSRSSSVAVQPQTCTSSGNSSPLHQLMVSASICCTEIGQTPGSLAVSNCQTAGIHTFTERHENQTPSRNLESCDQPMVQPTAVINSPWQSSVVHDQQHVSHVNNRTILQSANGYLHEASYLRPNVAPSTSSDPLLNELERMHKQEGDAVKIHEQKIMQLKSDCEKEIEEIRKKYKLLIQEADNALLQNKEHLGSHYTKVCANKLLAETLRYCQKRAPLAVSEEALLTALLQWPPLHHPMSAPTVSPTGAEPTAPPVQVVQQLSELVSINTSRPQYGSNSHITGNPQVGSQAPPLAPAQHLHRREPITSMAIPNVSASFYRVPHQQTLVCPLAGSLPVSYQLDVPPGFPVHLDGTQGNPVLL